MIKILIIIGFSFFSSPEEHDSIGVETINGKVFVIHRVEEKETLYAISRRYGASVDAILEYNSVAGSGLEIGQLLKVPYTKKENKVLSSNTHKVAPKETLFSIAKQYGVSLDDLKQANNLTDNALVIGQDLIIPKRSSVNMPASYQQEQTSRGSNSTTHTVVQKETMYSIARQYNITVDQLRQWNNLEGNELKIGQVLSVSQPNSAVKQSPAVVASNTSHTTPVVVEEKKEAATVVTEKKEVAQPVASVEKKEVPVVKEEPKEPAKQEVKEQTIKISESVRSGDEVVEAGLAELIEGTDGNRKYLALHRTAPVGTILKVRNEMNNREVFVRVMGKLPETAMTDKVVIRISKSAYDRLGAIDPKFRVEVTYYK
ncbi:LysM peptidoglycan-binding domain-containing protein [Chryseosolibacter indicus]|uniref:LysM peptidoglycan-binding domain-containing protein n=1 Tax=Chryseosolibacter indicus TaxID=2782351 RepID=A0ABS5VT56_9BACT|nr:LysM peptidoglycan-binding domain-containing protein [Chryseosolibacter indicus]MBT1704002.1 LysM peptidoglycan-binding domain-containing protein [Chryseosolibacter indicus]